MLKVITGLFLVSFLFVAFQFHTPKAEQSFVEYALKTNHLDSLFRAASHTKLEKEVLTHALNGLKNIQNNYQYQATQYLAISDFSVSSNKKRFYLFDLYSNKLVYWSLVSHGKSTGEECAESFSNISESHQSSLGFYRISEKYKGKHGASIRLDGLENSNSLARERAIVIHSADYVSEEFIQNHQRLGRSFGCPALPNENFEEIVDLISDNAFLFVYYPDANYLQESEILHSRPLN